MHGYVIVCIFEIIKVRNIIFLFWKMFPVTDMLLFQNQQKNETRPTSDAFPGPGAPQVLLIEILLHHKQWQSCETEINLLGEIVALGKIGGSAIRQKIGSCYYTCS